MTATVNTRRNEATRNFSLELLVVVSIVTLTNGVHGYAKPITWFVLALFVLLATCQPLIISKLNTDRTMRGTMRHETRCCRLKPSPIRRNQLASFETQALSEDDRSRRQDRRLGIGDLGAW